MASILSESSKSSSTESLFNKVQENVSQEVKFAINIVLNKFYLSNDIKELEFPSSLNSSERDYVHKLCEMNGLGSAVKGKRTKKFVYAYKKNDFQLNIDQPKLILSAEQKTLFEKFPLNITDKEKEDLKPKIQKQNNNLIQDFYKNLFNLVPSQAMVPKVVSSLNKHSICFYKQEILNGINMNRVVLINGENAIGKSSQIGQFVLEFYQLINQKCKIIFSVLNDLACYSLARKVSKQIGEAQIGHTIGCFCSRFNMSNGSLIFTTNDILLKNLISSQETAFLNSITHLIIDDVHLRDIYCDFIFILLKDILIRFKHLKVVLICSGSSNSSELIQKYFNPCYVLIIPSIGANIQEFYLEDIIKMTEYFKEDFIKKNLITNQSSCYLIDKWCIEKRKKSFFKNDLNKDINLNMEKIDVDSLLEKSWTEGNLSYFNQLINLIEKKRLDINYQHKDTSITMLMSAAISGHLEIVEKLLSLGANLFLKSCNELTALDWAKKFTKNEIIELIEFYSSSNLNMNEFLNSKELLLNENLKQIDDLIFLKAYYKQLSNQTGLINYDLILNLIKRLKSEPIGSILIFLPSCSEIFKLSDLLAQIVNFKIYKIFPEMKLEEIDQVYDSDERIIILSTKISEYLPSFRNITVIIDTGINREALHDQITTLPVKKNVWISKSCVYSRLLKGENTKNLKYFKIYSRNRFKSFPSQNLSQILTYPLQEICLLSKQTVPFNTSITDLISKAAESPAFFQLRNSINYLKSIDCLDTWEDMSDLGTHLINLPIELKYSKMILFSIVLKCLDPVLTIASCLSVGDPPEKDFGENYRKLISLKKALLEESLSDHFVLYKIYMNWKNSLENSKEFEFNNLIDTSFFLEIESLKNKILNYLIKFSMIRSIGLGDFNDLNSNSNNLNCIKACLVAGFYPNLLRYDKNNNRLLNDKQSKIKISINSVLWSEIFEKKISNEWLVFDDWTQTGSIQFIKKCTFVSPVLVALFSGPIKINENNFLDSSKRKDDSEHLDFKIDSWINFCTNKENFDLVLKIRQRWTLIFLKFIKFKTLDKTDYENLNLILKFITEDEKISKIIKQDKIEIKFSFRFDFNLRKSMEDVYFVTHGYLDALKIDSKSFLLAKNYSNRAKTIYDYLKQDGKIFVLFLDPIKQVWLGYAQLFLIPVNKNSLLDIFEFNDKYSILGLKILKYKTEPFSATNNFIDGTKLVDNQELDSNIARLILNLWS